MLGTCSDACLLRRNQQEQTVFHLLAQGGHVDALAWIIEHVFSFVSSFDLFLFCLYYPFLSLFLSIYIYDVFWAKWNWVGSVA